MWAEWPQTDDCFDAPPLPSFCRTPVGRLFVDVDGDVISAAGFDRLLFKLLMCPNADTLCGAVARIMADLCESADHPIFRELSKVRRRQPAPQRKQFAPAPQRACCLHSPAAVGRPG